MKKRFEGEDGRRVLVELLREQKMVGGDAALAVEIATVGELREIQRDTLLIDQNGEDTDCFLILSVSNSLSGRHWELDQVPAVGDPTDIVQLGSGAMQRCLNLGFSERIRNSRRTGDDATTALDLLTAVEGPLVRVTADAAYDTVAVYETAGARGATVVIPPARTATVSGHGPRSPARDRTITLVKTLGRRQWKKVSGYYRQDRVENTFFRYKSIIGDGLRARSPAGQASEVVLGCEILNRMTALGRPASYRIGR